jgi:hypothetical protein
MDIDQSPNYNSPYHHDPTPLVAMFQAEYCRAHNLPKEEPLEVVVDLGSRGGALAAIEKARKVMGDRLGNVRKWEDLPVCSFPYFVYGLLMPWSRWRYRYLRIDDIIPFLFARFRKSKRARRTHQRC